VAKQTQDEQRGQPAQPGRRRFGRASVAGGVILTLKSQSGMAGGVCKSPSAALSGGLSSHQPVKAPVCQGRGPEYWRTIGAAACGNGTTFGMVFRCNARLQIYGRSLLLTMLSPQRFDPDRVGMYLAAAYLNAVNNRTSFLKVPAVYAIWNEWQATGGNAGGYYTPIAGSKPWNSRQIVSYLAGTMT
jgi:hypothetical protein